MIETDKFNVLLVNDGKTHEVPFLKRLGDFSEETCKTVKDAKTGVEYPVLAALVDNMLKELDYRMVVIGCRCPMKWNLSVTIIRTDAELT